MPATISHAKSDTIADYTGTATVLNSAGATTTVLATNLVRPSDWNSAHAATLSVAASELFTAPFYEPFPAQNTNSTLSAPGVGTWYVDPFFLPHGIGSGQINFLAADAAGFLNGAVYSSAVTGSVSLRQTLSSLYCIYQAGTGANTTRIESLYSNSITVQVSLERRVSSTTAGGGTTTGVIITNLITLSFPSQYDASGGITYGSTAVSGSTSTSVSTAASTFANNIITGAVAFISGSKFMPIPIATTLAAGEYYMAFMISSTSSSTGTGYSTGTLFSTQSVVGYLEFVDQAYKRLGKSVSDTSTAILPFHGSVASTSTSPISPIATSDMRNQATNHRRYWNYLQSSY